MRKNKEGPHLQILSRENLKSNNSINSSDLQIGIIDSLPEKIIQFGEGNFLRGFVDWLVNTLNNKGLFNGSIVAIQPIKHGMVETINKQDGLYTLILRGYDNGKIIKTREIISSISRGIDIYKDFDKYMELADNPQIRYIISNTTEAGILFNSDDSFAGTPPESFPGKLTKLLYRRFQHFNGDLNKGFIIIPCELIDNNGTNLKNIVLKLSKIWDLGNEFINWLESANFFLNTLVDRVVTGYQAEEAEDIKQEFNYTDELLNTGEIFHLWVIEGYKKLFTELPFDKADLNVILTDDISYYRSRKVRILNGAHTMTSLMAYLYGLNTVKEFIDDNLLKAYMERGIFAEIIPSLNFPKDELIVYAKNVIERFANPYIKHHLLSISLNSVAKFKTRVLPSILDYLKIKNKLPDVLVFSFASLIAFYKGTHINDNCLIGNRAGNNYQICDDINILEYFKDFWSTSYSNMEDLKNAVRKILSNKSWWEMDLNDIDGLNDKVSEYLFNIITNGMENALYSLMNK